MISGSKNKKILHCNLMQAVMPVLCSDGVLVIHNPSSCSSIPYQAYHKLGAKYQEITGEKWELEEDVIYCTGLTNEDVVFGAGAKLLNCLMDIGKYRKPAFILVACGCIPGMIGDDTISICMEAEKKLRIPIILLPGHGFMVPMGIDSVLSASKLFFERFTVPRLGKKRKDRKVVSVIGMNPAYLSKACYQDFLDFLHILGFQTVYTFPIHMSVKDYENASESFAVVVWPQGVLRKDVVLPLGIGISNQMNVPCIDVHPCYCVADIRKMYLLAGASLGCMEQVEAQIRNRERKFYQKLEIVRQQVSSKTCSIYIDMGEKLDFMKGIIPFLQMAVGLSVREVILSRRITVRNKRYYQEYFDTRYPLISCVEEGNEKYHYDYSFTIAPFNLDLTERIILPEGIGFREYEVFLDSLVMELG